MQLLPYLMFPGNCRQALEHYKEWLGGEIEMMQTVGESPIEMPPEASDNIFNSSFRAKNLHFMASDYYPPSGYQAGTNFSMFVKFKDASEQAKVFENLSREGKVVMPLQGGFGMVEDLYRVRWMLALDQ